MVNVIGNDVATVKNLKCPYCGNTKDFMLKQVGSVPQRFTQDTDTGFRDFDSHDNELEDVCVEHDIICRSCDSLVAHRDVTIAVGPWVLNKKVELPYLIVVDAEYVRDTQIACTKDAVEDSESEGWENTSGGHVLGVFTAETEEDAVSLAAKKCGVLKETLLAYELKG